MTVKNFKGMINTDIERRKKILIHMAFLFVVIMLFYFAVKFSLSYILPIIIGLLVAFSVQKPAEFISKKIKVKKKYAALVCAVLSYFVIFSVIIGITVLCYFKISDLSLHLSDYADKLYELGERTTEYAKKMTENFSEKASEKIYSAAIAVFSGIFEKAAAVISDNIATVAAAMPEFLFSAFVSVISGCYIAFDFEAIKEFLLEALPKKYIDSLILLRDIAVNNIFGMIKGYAIISGMAFAEIYIFFLIFGVKKALIKALLIAFVDILPVFGSGTVLIPWAIISGISGNLPFCIKLICIYAVVTVVRNFAEPKVLGKQTGVHPLITLISIFAGLKIFGVSGIIVLPLTVTVLIHYAKEKYKASLV